MEFKIANNSAQNQHSDCELHNAPLTQTILLGNFRSCGRSQLNFLSAHLARISHFETEIYANFNLKYEKRMRRRRTKEKKKSFAFVQCCNVIRTTVQKHIKYLRLIYCCGCVLPLLLTLASHIVIFCS